MSKRPAFASLGALMILAMLAGLQGAANAQQKHLWYRGDFDGDVTVRDIPAQGYYYTPSKPSAYPLFENRWSSPLPCDQCGHYHPASGYCQACRHVCRGNGSHVDKDTVYSPNPLPGQYYYEKQPHFNFQSPIHLGWPYMKYDTQW